MIFLGADYSQMGLSPEQMQERMGKWMAWSGKMGEAGIIVNGHALTPDVRHVSGPDRVVTDRTSAEVKELVGGYWVIKAESKDAVVEIAADYPDYDLGGTVEIREIMVF